MLTEIIARVAKISWKHVSKIMESSLTLAIEAAQPHVYKNINLRPLTIHPLASLRRYNDLMERCLAAGNLEAHYVRGIHENFHKNNTTGACHISKSQLKVCMTTQSTFTE